MFEIVNDLAGLCDPGPACSDSGSFTATGSQIVLDPGTIDEATLNYSISGTTMNVTGNIDGTLFAAVLIKN